MNDVLLALIILNVILAIIVGAAKGSLRWALFTLILGPALLVIMIPLGIALGGRTHMRGSAPRYYTNDGGRTWHSQW